jgi:hypothetical protein
VCSQYTRVCTATQEVLAAWQETLLMRHVRCTVLTAACLGSLCGATACVERLLVALVCVQIGVRTETAALSVCGEMN